MSLPSLLCLLASRAYAQDEGREAQAQLQQRAELLRAAEDKMAELRTEIERLNGRIADAAEAEQKAILVRDADTSSSPSASPCRGTAPRSRYNRVENT